MRQAAARTIAGRAALVVALAAALYSYEPLNHATAHVHVLRTPLDAALPFVPLMAIPYLLFLPFVLGTLLLFALMDWPRFRTLALAVILAALAADLAFIAFQTYVARPSVAGDDLGARLVRAVYAGDQPYNGFPSLHVAFSTLCLIAYARWRWAYALAALPLVAAIIAATVLIRQHYLADVAGGLALASLAYWMVVWITERQKIFTPLAVRARAAGER
jgi:membrane-associated phospholipid phosphatase